LNFKSNVETNFIRPYKLQSCNARTAAGKSRCPPLTSALGRKHAGQADASAADPDASRAKKALLPPPCWRPHRRRCPWMHPRAPLTLPYLFLGCKRAARATASAAQPRREPSKASAAPPPLPAPLPPQTFTDAPASTADPPPPLPWAASAQRKPPHQRPDPNASPAKQSKRRSPPPASAIIAADVHGCAHECR
jgi:hypothetical protein